MRWAASPKGQSFKSWFLRWTVSPKWSINSSGYFSKTAAAESKCRVRINITGKNEVPILLWCVFHPPVRLRRRCELVTHALPQGTPILWRANNRFWIAGRSCFVTS